MSTAYRPPRRVLVSVDLDAAAEVALARGLEWSRHFDAALTVLHVIRKTSDRAQASRSLDALVRRVTPRGVPAPDPTVALGEPAEMISEAIVAAGVDLVVLGSHGRGVVERVVLGSVTATVLAGTGAPVLIVRQAAPVRGPVVASVDLSDVSDAVVYHAAGWALARGESLRLLHVLPIGDHESPGHVVMKKQATRALDAVRERRIPSTVSVQSHVAMRMEPPAAAIARYSDDEGASLIVMGGHGHSGWIRGGLGGVTARLLHETSIPVLVIRQR